MITTVVELQVNFFFFADMLLCISHISFNVNELRYHQIKKSLVLIDLEK